MFCSISSNTKLSIAQCCHVTFCLSLEGIFWSFEQTTIYMVPTPNIYIFLNIDTHDIIWRSMIYFKKCKKAVLYFYKHYKLYLLSINPTFLKKKVCVLYSLLNIYYPIIRLLSLHITKFLKNSTLHQITHKHYDFTQSPKSREKSKKKKRGQEEKWKILFYIVFVGAEHDFFKTVS